MSLRSFLRVAETGSFSAVAAERGVTQPAISRQISALEQHLGTQLVQRSTQAVTLTDDGRRFQSSARALVDAADAMIHFAAHRRDKPIGHVRLSAPACPGLYISRRLPELLARHDELSVELVVRDDLGKVIEEGLDLEVRIGPAEDASLVTRRVGYAEALVVASPQYLAAHGVPKHPSDLTDHECIVCHAKGGDRVLWFHKGKSQSEKDEFEIRVEVSGRFSANSSSAVYHAVLAGHGIGSLASYLVAEDLRAGRLVQLLTDYSQRGWPLYISYPARRVMAPRTRAVIDFLITILQDPQVGLAIGPELQLPAQAAFQRTARALRSLTACPEQLRRDAVGCSERG